MPELPDAPAFELAPDWICEVLSPSTMAIDRAEKMPIYAREQVKSVWLLDPIARTLEICQLEQRRWMLVGTWRDDAPRVGLSNCQRDAEAPRMLAVQRIRSTARARVSIPVTHALRAHQKHTPIIAITPFRITTANPDTQIFCVEPITKLATKIKSSTICCRK